jgi:hypothetical protein
MSDKGLRIHSKQITDNFDSPSGDLKDYHLQRKVAQLCVPEKVQLVVNPSDDYLDVPRVT